MSELSWENAQTDSWSLDAVAWSPTDFTAATLVRQPARAWVARVHKLSVPRSNVERLPFMLPTPRPKQRTASRTRSKRS